jgi:beta-N-acetylhexosaminidase
MFAVRHHPRAKAVSKRATKAEKDAAREEKVATRWARSLSLHDAVAQLIVVPFSGQPLPPRSKPYKDLFNLVRRTHVGGLILVNVFEGHLIQHADPLDAAKLINKLQGAARIPLLFSADLERGASMRLNDTTTFPHAMAFAAGGNPGNARAEGVITAREARAVGIQWIFYPVADVNSNPDNPIINIRSFGEDPADVSRYVTAFIEGAHSDPRYRVLTTAKHFPGHGDTSTDTHLNLATIPATRQHLEEVELPPFRAAIQAGVDSIMTAHLALPAIEDPATPATLSPAILTGLLRHDLGFKGLIVTDAMEMGGIAKGFTVGDASVRAIEAGADVLLMPSDPLAAIDAVVGAVKTGRITRQRINESVHRILLAKAHVGLDRGKRVNVKAIPKLVDLPDANAAAQRVADASITLVRNEGALLPLRDPSKVLFLLLTENSKGQEGQAFAQELKKRLPTADFRILDPAMSPADLDSAVQAEQSADAVVAVAFVSVAAYSGNVALRGGYPELLRRLTKPVVLAALGSPYLLRAFPDVAVYLTSYSTVPPSEIAVVKALLGEIPFAGKLPVSIPGLAPLGAGIVNTR